MFNYLTLDDNGLVVGYTSSPFEVEEGEKIKIAPPEVTIENYSNYVFDRVNRQFVLSIRPSAFHSFENGNWILQRDSIIKSISYHFNNKRAIALRSSSLFAENNFDSDPQAISNIQSTLLVFQASRQLPPGFVWRTADNQNVPMTYELLDQLAQAIYARNAQIYAESWALKDSLPSKTDQELLDLYQSLTDGP